MHHSSSSWKVYVFVLHCLHYDTHGEATDVYEPYPDVVDSPLRMHVNLN